MPIDYRLIERNLARDNWGDALSSALAQIMQIRQYREQRRERQDLQQQELSDRRDYRQQQLAQGVQRLDLARGQAKREVDEEIRKKGLALADKIGGGLDAILSQPRDSQQAAYEYFLDDIRKEYPTFNPAEYGFEELFSPSRGELLRDTWRRTSEAGRASAPRPTQPPTLMQRDPTKPLVNPQTGEEVSPGIPEPRRVTYGPPQTQMVDGKRTLVRPGSDGQMYDMNLRPIAAEQIAPEPERQPQGPAPQYQWSRDPKTGDIRLMTPQEIRASGSQQPPTADMRNKVAGRELVAKSLSPMEKLSATIIAKVGPAQRADAIKRGAEAVFGTDPEFRTYQDARMALAGNLAVAQQGSRVSDQDVKALWLPLVPDPYRDTAESAAMKWEMIRTMSNIPPSETGGSSGAGTAPPPAPVPRAPKKNPF